MRFYPQKDCSPAKNGDVRLCFSAAAGKGGKDEADSRKDRQQMVFPIHKLRYLSCVRPFCDAEQSASYVFILYTYWRKISMQNSGGHLDRCGFLLFSHKICRIWTAHTASRMCIKLHAPFPVAPQGRGSGTFLILLHFCIAKKEHHPDGWCSYLVPVVGLEPTRYRYQRILSPSRLPIPSHRH